MVSNFNEEDDSTHSPMAKLLRLIACYIQSTVPCNVLKMKVV